MSILMTEYDYATDMAVLKEESYEDGLFVCLATGREEGREEGISIGLEQGLERGAYQKALETARNLLAMGLSPEQISQATKLPQETISHLAATDGDMIRSGLF